MAHPKSRISKQRRDKRRTHYKATPETITTCPTTGQPHLRHTAHEFEGVMYYKGKPVMEVKTRTKGSSASDATE
jgi:large subunit ribosomal protein L32